MDYGNMRQGHPHPEAARNRNAATIAMSTAITALGFEPYVISPSLREQSEKGQRFFFTAADIAQEYRDDVITPNSIIMMTDVDYHCDLPAVLSHGRPILTYTMQPTKVADSVSEGHFTIGTDNILKFYVGGGKTVEHEIWDYSQDVVLSYKYSETWCGAFLDALHHLVTGLPAVYTVASYVDMWQTAPHRRIVALVPFAELPSLFGTRLSGSWLTRVKYDVGNGFNAVVNYGGVTPLISIAQYGECAQATLPLARLEALKISHAAANAKALSDTARRSDLPKDQAAVLHAYLRSVHTAPAEVYTPAAARHYQVVTPDASDADKLTQGKSYARSYAPAPLGASAVFPVESPENARASIKGRVDKPQKKSRSVNIGTDYAELADEFVKLTVGKHVGVGTPLDVAEVDDRQNKPMQRVRTAQRNMDTEEPFMVKAFQKREAYNTPNDPRTISSVPTMHTLKLSSYTYSMKEKVLKEHQWYIPGANPETIAQRMMEVAHNADSLTETDFSRFDGTVNQFLRTRVEHAVYLRWVAAEHRNELSDLLEAELNPKARLNDIKYEPGCSRLSGSPLTSDGNTLINAFAQYATMRKNDVPKMEAFNNIGLICGDDAVVPSMGISSDSRTKIAARIGLSLKVEREVKEVDSDPHVSFLSRIFKDPWNSPASIQSPKRALLKVHTTVDTVSDLSVAGRSKAQGYAVTDSCTPVLGNWVKCYLRNVEQGNADATRDIPYYATLEFRDSPWPQASGFEEIVADDLGITSAEVLDYCKELDLYTGPVDGMPCLSLPQPDIKITSVLDGEIQQAGSSSNSTTDNNNGQSQQSQPTTETGHRGTPVPKSSDGDQGGAMLPDPPVPRTDPSSSQAEGSPRTPPRTASLDTVGGKQQPHASGAGAGGNRGKPAVRGSRQRHVRRSESHAPTVPHQRGGRGRGGRGGWRGKPRE
jgi:hypothetical protein